MGQSASFTPRTITLGAMSKGVKQSNSSWYSHCDRRDRRHPSLILNRFGREDYVSQWQLYRQDNPRGRRPP